jgi:hypothetical protein
MDILFGCEIPARTPAKQDSSCSLYLFVRVHRIYQLPCCHCAPPLNESTYNSCMLILITVAYPFRSMVGYSVLTYGPQIPFPTVTVFLYLNFLVFLNFFSSYLKSQVSISKEYTPSAWPPAPVNDPQGPCSPWNSQWA